MPRAPSLSIAFAGYGIALVLTLSAAALSVRGLDAAAADWLSASRTHEYRVTLAERLRWRSELRVAATRGLVISNEPVFREKLQEATASIRQLIRDLQRTEDDARGRTLLAAVARSSAAYDRKHDELFGPAHPAPNPKAMAVAFERELLPLRRSLDAAVDRYVSRQRALLEEAYGQIDRQRVHTRALAIGSLALAGLGAAGLLWFVSRALSRMYARERAALAGAQDALAARDQMLGIVAHDLRNPLSAIAMKAALLENEDNPDVRRHAGAIAGVAARMERLIATLLDVASIEAGRFSIHPTRCAAAPLLQELTALFDAAAADRSLRLKCSTSNGELTFRGDRERVLQVLTNLVGNALKFTPEGGTIQLAAERDGEFVRFSVADTGPGIDPEAAPRIFDRFWKKDSPTVKGTGLGLFISKGIVEAHGGRIWVETVPGSGATFRFTLPLARPS